MELCSRETFFFLLSFQTSITILLTHGVQTSILHCECVRQSVVVFFFFLLQFFSFSFSSPFFFFFFFFFVLFLPPYRFSFFFPLESACCLILWARFANGIRQTNKKKRENECLSPISYKNERTKYI